MLKNLLLVALTVTVATLGSAKESQADNYVRGHLRSSGSYVNPYYRSNADGNFWNNYSTSPNVNPYTGCVGTHHYPTRSSSYNPWATQYGADAPLYAPLPRPVNLPSWVRW